MGDHPDERDVTDESELDLNNPHDHFFRKWMGKPEHSAGFFRATMPEELLPWVADPANLELQNVSFVSDELRSSQSDLLWRCKNEGDTAGYLYILFEHQKKPDPFMAARMLFYLVKIWERIGKEGLSETGGKLPFVFPIVLYQGDEKWPGPVRFSELVAIPGEELKRFVPDFEFRLCSLEAMDLSQFTPKTLRVGLSAMTLPFTGQYGEWLRNLRAISTGTDGELTGMGIVIRYVMAIAPVGERVKMLDIAKEKDDPVGKEATTVAESLLFEGMEKGMEKQLRDTVLRMRDAGFPAERIADILGVPGEKVCGILADDD